MTIQRPHKLEGACLCACGKSPKAYSLDFGKSFHIECHPCKIITPQLKSLENCKRVFLVMVRAVLNDSIAPQEICDVRFGVNRK